MFDDGWSNDPWDVYDADKFIMCNRCGKENLIWKKVEEKWVLFSKDKQHNCYEYLKEKMRG